MPAAAVIPAPIAYIKVVAVKKLVVGFLGDASAAGCTARSILLGTFWYSLVGFWNQIFYFEKIRVFQAGLSLEYLSME